MKRGFASLLAAAAMLAPVAAQAATVEWLTVHSEITNATVSYLERGLKKADDEKADLVVIELDTPGGRLDSTWTIVEDELNSKVPVVVFVSPRGAHAGSAGVYITLAANIAAMAPDSRIGSAHPVMGESGFVWPAAPSPSGSGAPAATPSATATPDLAFPGAPPGWNTNGQELAKKVQNDTLSWADSIAHARHRNDAWLRKAVLESVSITAEDAVQQNVVDLLATDREDLLRKLDGRAVDAAGAKITLAGLAQSTVVDVAPTLPERVVAWLADPTIILFLFLIAALGAYVEFNHPGMILPGAISAVAAVAFLVAINAVPINIAGILLVLVGLLCLVLEVKFHSYLLLTLAGLTCIVLGLTLLVDPRKFDVPLHWTLVVPGIAAVAGIMVFIAFLAVRALQRPVLGDSRELVGRVVTVAKAIDASGGKVTIDGVFWNAVTKGGAIAEGAHVRIVEVEGLTLHVLADANAPLTPAPTDVPVTSSGGLR